MPREIPSYNVFPVSEEAVAKAEVVFDEYSDFLQLATNNIRSYDQTRSNFRSTQRELFDFMVTLGKAMRPIASQFYTTGGVMMFTALNAEASLRGLRFRRIPIEVMNTYLYDSADIERNQVEVGAGLGPSGETIAALTKRLNEKIDDFRDGEPELMHLVKRVRDFIVNPEGLKIAFPSLTVEQATNDILHGMWDIYGVFKTAYELEKLRNTVSR